MTLQHPSMLDEATIVAGKQTRTQERQALCMAVAAFVLLMLSSVAFQ
jgi:hypothetical protein